jgi:mono/diheme cytochrome c family protein
VETTVNRDYMPNRLPELLCGLSLLLVLSACENSDPPVNSPPPRKSAEAPASKKPQKAARWYKFDAVQRGAMLYKENCASCHGDKGQGAVDWRKQGADGVFPAPPLNGTGHAWHHPLKALGSQIKFGAPGGRGNMPGFSKTLSDEQILEVIAWFQNQWSDENYVAWSTTEKRAREAAK